MKGREPIQIIQAALDRVFPGWTVSGVCARGDDDAEWAYGYQRNWRGRDNVVSVYHSPDGRGQNPARLTRTVALRQRHPVLEMEVASQNMDTDFMLSVLVNGKRVLGPRVICTPNETPYERILVPLERWKGRKVKIEIEYACNNWYLEHAFFGRLDIVDGTGKEKLGAVGIDVAEVFPRADPKSKAWKSRDFWRYTDRAPDAGWMELGFDDSKWKRTKKAVGAGVPELPMSVAEVCESDRLWFRRTFNWSGSLDVYKAVLDVFYDQDVKVYLNGTHIADLKGWNVDWRPLPVWTKPFTKALKKGKNVLAFSLDNSYAARFFDCGLVIETRKPVR